MAEATLAAWGTLWSRAPSRADLAAADCCNAAQEFGSICPPVYVLLPSTQGFCETECRRWVDVVIPPAGSRPSG